MKKYLVSLALKVPCNFEARVEANSEKEAFDMAVEEWDNKDDLEKVTEPLWEELELDVDMESKLDNLGNGIFIEEITK